LDEKEIFDKLVLIVLEQLDVAKEDITLESSFVDDLGADSLDQVELIMAVEEFFDIPIEDEDAEKLLTVQNVVDFVVKSTT